MVWKVGLFGMNEEANLDKLPRGIRSGGNLGIHGEGDFFAIRSEEHTSELQSR